MDLTNIVIAAQKKKITESSTPISTSGAKLYTYTPNKLQEVITPPVTPLTPYLPKTTAPLPTKPSAMSEVSKTITNVVMMAPKTVQEAITVSKLSASAIETAAAKVASGETQMAPEAAKTLEPLIKGRDIVVERIKETAAQAAATPVGKIITAGGGDIWRGTQQGIAEGLASESRTKRFAAGVIQTTTGTLVGTATLGVGLSTHPLKTSAGLLSGIMKAPSKVITAVKTQPASTTTGQIIGLAAGGIMLSKAGEFGKAKVSNLFVKTGAKEIPSTQLFAEEVLAGKKTMPLVKSTQETIQLFKETKGKTVGTTTTSEDLFGLHSTSGFPKKAEIQITAGPKGAVGLEDPGLYITPTGKGSPYFLGIEPQTGYKISLKPFNVPKVKPSVIEIGFKEIKTLPPSVLKEPGFAPVTKYFEKTAAGESAAYITKRSTIGQAEIPKQTYINPTEYKSPLTGKTIPTGTKLVTAGTSEIEAVIPKTATIVKVPTTTFLGKLKGYEQYTIYKGRAVPIRRFTIVPRTLTTEAIGPKVTAEIRKYGPSYSISGLVSAPKIITPYPTIVSAVFFKPKTTAISIPKVEAVSIKPTSEVSAYKPKLVSTAPSYVPRKQPSYIPSYPSRRISGGISIPKAVSVSPVKPSEVSYPKTTISSYIPRYTPKVSSIISIPKSSRPVYYSKPKQISYISRPKPSSYKPTVSSYKPKLYSSYSYYKPGGISSYPKQIPYSSSSQKQLKIFSKHGAEGRPVYVTEVRRYGRFVPVGLSRNVGAATKIGQKRVLTTLAASFRIRKAGTGKFIPIVTSKAFRPAKRESFVFVQKKGGREGGLIGGRLASRGEIREIQLSKRRRI